jgi:hypothetical protein
MSIARDPSVKHWWYTTVSKERAQARRQSYVILIKDEKFEEFEGKEATRT